jgi:hypothetical protein
MALDKVIDAVLPDWPVLPPPARAEVSGHCARFVRAQLALAPFHIRMGVAVLFAAFRLYLLFTRGPWPSRASHSAALTGFSALPLPLVAGLERLLRAATILAFFDEPAVLAALGEEGAPARQRDFRAVYARSEGRTA